MSRSISVAIALLFAGLLTLAFTGEAQAAKEKAKPAVMVEDNMGFVGTAWLFTLQADGTWERRQFFPRTTKRTKTGNLSKDETNAFIAKLEKAGAFNAKAKDIEPKNPQLADGAYFAVTNGAFKGKGGRLQFKHGGPTSKAVKAVIDDLVGGAEATE